VNATFDNEADAYYFSADDGKVAKTIDLGTRHVLVDVDNNGKIIGVEVL
jgi:uncharacterized protein YuzE